MQRSRLCRRKKLQWLGDRNEYRALAKRAFDDVCPLECDSLLITDRKDSNNRVAAKSLYNVIGKKGVADYLKQMTLDLRRLH